jgi:hypothetical protein
VYDPSGEILFEMGSAGNDGNSDSRQGHYNGPVLNTASRFGSGSGSVRITPNYFYAFDSVDVRRDVTITTYAVPTSSNIKIVRRLGELTTGKYRRDWRVPLLPGAAINLSINWALIRFSDVLLMYAEAVNEINNGPTPAAIAAFEEVRRRGYRTNPIGTTPTDKAGFFNAIVNERFLEFGEEGIRKYDLIRWNMLASKIAEARLRITQIQARTGPYALVPQYVYYKNTGEELTYYTAADSVNGRPFWRATAIPPIPASIAPTAPASGTAVTRWVRVDWAQNTTSTTGYEGTSLDKNIARFFTPGKSELFPYDQVTLDAYQGKLKQNPGY